MTTTYEIPEANRADLDRAIDRINRRAERLGCPPVVVRTVSTRLVEHESGHVDRFTTVAIEGEAPRLQGWEVVATVTHTSEVDLVHTLPRAVAALTAEQVEEYRENGPACEHCKQSRRRNRTFVLRHETGEAFTQVGSTCLKDFFHGVEADTLASGAGLLVEAANAAHAASVLRGSYGGPPLYSLRRVLAYTAAAIRRYGWCSKTAERDGRGYATVRRVLTAFDAVERFDTYLAHEVEIPFDDDYVLADAALEWAQALDESENDYLGNVRAVALAGCVEYKTAGIAASIVSAFQRARRTEWEEARKRTRKTSQYLNAVGQRCFWRARVEIAAEFPGDYGVTTFFLLRDADDNVIVWRSSRAASHTPEFVKGAVVEFTATVKRHEFNEKYGERQTLVTRVSNIVKAAEA